MGGDAISASAGQATGVTLGDGAEVYFAPEVVAVDTAHFGPGAQLLASEAGEGGVLNGGAEAGSLPDKENAREGRARFGVTDEGDGVALVEEALGVAATAGTDAPVELEDVEGHGYGCV
jgi:hypothetical protein